MFMSFIIAPLIRFVREVGDDGDQRLLDRITLEYNSYFSKTMLSGLYCSLPGILDEVYGEVEWEKLCIEKHANRDLIGEI